MTIFLALNGQRLEVTTDDAVYLMLAIAASERDEKAVTRWLEDRVEPFPTGDGK